MPDVEQDSQEPPYFIVVRVPEKRPSAPWSKEEAAALLRLVPMAPPEYTNWQDIAQQLGRTPTECFRKYEEMIRADANSSEGNGSRKAESAFQRGTASSPLSEDHSRTAASPSFEGGVQRVESLLCREASGSELSPSFQASPRTSMARNRESNGTDALDSRTQDLVEQGIRDMSESQARALFGSLIKDSRARP